MAKTAELKAALDKSTSILKRLKPIRFSKKVSEMDGLDYANQVLRYGVNKEELYGGKNPVSIGTVINNILASSDTVTTL